MATYYNFYTTTDATLIHTYDADDVREFGDLRATLMVLTIQSDCPSMIAMVCARVADLCDNIREMEEGESFYIAASTNEVFYNRSLEWLNNAARENAGGIEEYEIKYTGYIVKRTAKQYRLYSMRYNLEEVK